MQIIVPDALIKDAEDQWAPHTDPIFDLIPVGCEEHISSVYAELGSPEINISSFWDVYNQVCDAVDSEFLCRTTADTFPHGESTPDLDGVVEQLPLSNLRPCVFGENGVPAAQIYEGEADILFLCFTSSLPDILRFQNRPTRLMMTDQVGHRSVAPSMHTHTNPEVDFEGLFTDDDGDEIY